MKKVAVLLSGGVDSSVALSLVKRVPGHEVTAFYLKIWLEDELAFLGECPWEEDLKHARAVCEKEGVPLQIVSLQSEYQERIVSHVVRELKRGRTPSPDILCNQWIKFGLFCEKIDPGFERIVSGHYARVCEGDGVWLLKRSPDPVKDQTYFLSGLNQDQLRRLWFPIGHLHKHEVRALAQEFDLPNRDRGDSQGICFLGKIKYPDFVRFHLGDRRGEIVDVDTGRKLAEHNGVWYHTVGQRKGLGLGGGPWYVVRKDLETNRVYVAHADRYREHSKREFVVDSVHWIGDPPRSESLETKVRHSPHLERCRILPLEAGRLRVTLENEDQGIAPGQSAIFYEGDICLGGGVIE
jgi:tRNA (5-methylaminomethyl-2-thiouridylate)-methyltransferase